MSVQHSDLGLALFEEEYLQNPHPLYAQMHAEAPIHRVGGSDFFAVCGWDTVLDAVGRTEDFSSNLTGAMRYRPDVGVDQLPLDALGSPTQVLATADDPAHALHRKMLVPQLAGRRIRDLEQFVTETVDALSRRLTRGETVEWMGAVADRLPMTVVCKLIGVPDGDTDRIGAWAYASTLILNGRVDDTTLSRAGTAALELAAYIGGQLHDAAANPRDNLLGDLATACAAGDLDLLTAQVMLVTLFSAGGESTASLIGSATNLLATRADLQERLRAEPGLVPAFLEEVLRYEPPFRGHYRHVLRDCELGGQHLQSGSRLLLLWGAANRDPRHFDEPDRFVTDRPNGKAHLAFGKGAHFCVGAALARFEARIVLEHLLAHTDSIQLAGAPHWVPSLLVRRLATLPVVLG